MFEIRDNRWITIFVLGYRRERPILSSKLKAECCRRHLHFERLSAYSSITLLYLAVHGSDIFLYVTPYNGRSVRAERPISFSKTRSVPNTSWIAHKSRQFIECAYERNLTLRCGNERCGNLQGVVKLAGNYMKSSEWLAAQARLQTTNLLLNESTQRLSLVLGLSHRKSVSTGPGVMFK